MACTAAGASHERPRTRFVRDTFLKKCCIGNEDVCFDNVVFISRRSFLEGGQMRSYADMAHEHCHPERLSQNDIVLFVSHRWQDSNCGKPDVEESHSQFCLVSLFLSSDAGRFVTHLWLDYSCIASREQNLHAFNKHVHNVQTALFLADVFLIVPKISYLVQDTHEPILYTDLTEMSSRGWCIFEAFAAIAAQAEIFITFAQGSISQESCFFLKVDGGVPPGSNTDFVITPVHNLSFQSRSFVSALQSADFSMAPDKIRSSWYHVLDPAGLCLNFFEAAKELEAERRVSFTVSVSDSGPLSTHSEPGARIAEMLKHVTSAEDRSVITNLLANVAGFCIDGFASFTDKAPTYLEGLASAAFVDKGLLVLDLRDKKLFAGDVRNILLHCDRTIATNCPFALRLDTNPLGYLVANALSSFQAKGSHWYRLKELGLDQCGLQDIGVIDLMASVQLRNGGIDLTFLSLARNDIGPEGAEALASNSTVTCLNLANNNVGAKGARALSRNGILRYLNLSQNSIGAVGAELLAAQTSLTYLNLSHNDIGPDGSTPLAKNCTLKTLNLWNNRIGPAGAALFSSNTSLTSLNLDLNGVGPEGALELAKNTTLTTLGLSLNQLGDVGAWMISLNSTLLDLSLRQNTLHADTIAALEDASFFQKAPQMFCKASKETQPPPLLSDVQELTARPASPTAAGTLFSRRKSVVYAEQLQTSVCQPQAEAEDVRATKRLEDVTENGIISAVNDARAYQVEELEAPSAAPRIRSCCNLQ